MCALDKAKSSWFETITETICMIIKILNSIVLTSINSGATNFWEPMGQNYFTNYVLKGSQEFRILFGIWEYDKQYYKYWAFYNKIKMNVTILCSVNIWLLI